MATTRAIAGDRREINNVRVNEAYIYRIFTTKERLFAEIFSLLDHELLAAIKDGLSEFNNEPDKKTQWEILFNRLWTFLLSDEDKCRFYVRYYYSVYLKGESLRAHHSKFRDFVCDLMPYFVENADVCSILQHVVTVVLSFAVCIFNGTLQNDDDNTHHIFNVVYSSISPYLI